MTTDLVRTCYILFALSLAWSTGCRPPAAQSSIYIDVKRVPLDMRDEYTSFAVNCSKCHGLARALNAPVTDPKHWDLYVARMMRTAGSAISPHEAPVILRFLHWYTASYKHNSELPGDIAAPEASADVAPPAPIEAAPADPAPSPIEPTTQTPVSTAGSPQPAQDTPTQSKTEAGGNQ